MVQSQLPTGAHQFGQYPAATTNLVDPSCLAEYQNAMAYIPSIAAAGIQPTASAAAAQNNAMVLALQQQAVIQQHQALVAQHSLQQVTATSSLEASIPVSSPMDPQLTACSQLTPPLSNNATSEVSSSPLLGTNTTNGTSEINNEVFLLFCLYIYIYIYLLYIYISITFKK